MLKDKVKCNSCDYIGLVDRDADDCPKCHNSGNLQDIKQDLEV